MKKKYLSILIIQIVFAFFSYITYSDQWDPADDSFSTAVNLETPGSQEITHGPHTLSPTDSADWFNILLNQGVEYEFFTIGEADTNVDFFFATEGNLILSQDGGGEGNNFKFSFTPLVTETYYLRIQLSKSGDLNSYTLHVVNITESAASTDPWDSADNTYSGATQLFSPGKDDQTHGPHFLSIKDRYDWFAFPLIAGTTYIFSSTGKLDTQVDLYAMDGVTRLASNDNNLQDGNFLLYFVPEKTESYYLRVSQHNEDVSGEYLLHYQISGVPVPQGDPWDPKDDILEGSTHVGSPTEEEQFHGPHALSDYDRNDWFTANLQADAEYLFRFTGEKSLDVDIFDTNGTTLLVYDVNLEQKNEFSVKFVPGTSGQFYLRVFKKNAGNAAYTFFAQLLSKLPTPILDQWDPVDDTLSAATDLESPLGSDSTHGPHTLSLNDHYDWFSFLLTEGVTYTFWTSGNADTYAEIYGEDGKTLLLDKDGGGIGYNFNLIFTPSTDGRYALRVRLYDMNAQGEYVLHYQIKQPDPVGEDEWDPIDNTFAGATKLGTPPSLVKSNGPHVLSSMDKEDWFEFSLEKGYVYEFTTLSDSDTMGTLIFSDGVATILTDDNGGIKQNFKINYIPYISETYYLRITELSGKNAVYTLFYRGEPYTAVAGWMMY